MATNADPFKDPSHSPRIAAAAAAAAAAHPEHDTDALPNTAANTGADVDGKANDDALTLKIGSDVSLTLGTDSLVVLDEALSHRRGFNVCGIRFAGKNKATRTIPFYNVLWAEISTDGEVIIQYARTVSKTVVRPATISYKVDKPDSSATKSWVENLLARAYGSSQRQKRVKMLVNPFGGQGHAVKLYHKHIAPMFAAARCEVDMEQTNHKGHGTEIAQGLDIDAFDVIACCSGDGIPYEVWNGLGKREDAARALARFAVVQLPCGSGNALSLNLNGTASPSLASLAVIKGIRTALDLTSITQGNTRTLSCLSQNVGIIAECDLGTENLRWMGSSRFTYGFLVRVMRQTCYPADIAVKVEYGTKPAIREAYRSAVSKPGPPPEASSREATAGLPPLKYGTVADPLPEGWELIPHPHLGTFYAGNLAYMSPDLNFFPASLPSDGCVDIMQVRGDEKRLTAIKSLIAVGENKHFDLDHVDYKKVSAYRIIPRNQETGYISIDGERIPFEPFQAEVHRGLGMTLSKSGRGYEAPGV